MIRVDIRRKAFGETEILRDISFTVAPGSTVAILGASGIGKSTLLNLVAGIDTDFTGQITRTERIAIVFQEPVLLPWRSVLQNITLVHEGLGAGAALDALARVGIVDKAALFPGQLSLGQQRRVALARAFAGQPQLLIMDEPFASLDPATADDMLLLTERLIAETGPATIFVTHARREAERLADQIYELGGSPATIVTSQPRKETP
ncbi:MAG TPA: ABC transporter ATP-binding protein [Roseovarius sp.]